MAKEKGYQGWANYETWLAALWIDNERSSHEESRRIAKEAADAEPDQEMKKYRASDALKEWMGEFLEEAQEKLGPTLWSDLLRGAWDEIDWDEIAENALEE